VAAYPEHGLFKDGLFDTAEFKASASTVCQVEDNPAWSENKNIQAVVPEISAMLAGMRQESGIRQSRALTLSPRCTAERPVEFGDS
jgi:hypothetical protein